jgi:integrase
MSLGSVVRRGKTSWRLKYEADRDPITGKRVTRYVTVRGTKKQAQAELVRLLAQMEDGAAVNPSKLTIAAYLRSWLEYNTELSPKTLERYRQLAEQQIIPHLGAIPLQKLRPADVQEWHAILLQRGGDGGRSLSARTVGHAHRVLRAALARAANVEIIARNVTAVVRPPKVAAKEIAILSPVQVADVLARLQGHILLPPVTVALGTGIRRGELCGLRWSDVDLAAATIRIEHSIEETAAGLRQKAPKSRHGRRTLSLPRATVEALQAHRLWQAEQRLACGLGRPSADDLVFTAPDGRALSPDNLSRDWRRAVLALKLPAVMFHGLRHTHASTLIAGGVDVLTISRRLGHATPASLSPSMVTCSATPMLRQRGRSIPPSTAAHEFGGLGCQLGANSPFVQRSPV